MPISDNIKKLRQIFDLSQKELAVIAGVTDKAVSTWENGNKEPRMGTIQRIADHFNLQKSNLIEDNGLDNLTRHGLIRKDSVLSSNDLPRLTPKDEREIVKDLESMINSLDDKSGMAAYNDPEDEEDRELLKSSLLTSMRLAKQIAKKKFTPKKYREE